MTQLQRTNVQGREVHVKQLWVFDFVAEGVDHASPLQIEGRRARSSNVEIRSGRAGVDQHLGTNPVDCDAHSKIRSAVTTKSDSCVTTVGQKSLQREDRSDLSV